MDKELRQFIGVPWLLGGRTLAGCDCLGLALLVQRELFGRPIPDVWSYDPTDYAKKSLLFPDEMLALGFCPVSSPAHGDVAYAEIAGFGHLSTFLNGAHLTITQFSASTWKVRRFPFRYFRPKEVQLWLSVR